MKKRTDKINSTRTIVDPIFNDFLYTILYNSSYAEKRGLPGKYLRAASDQALLKQFIISADDEDKKVILTHFGYRFFWGFIREDFKHRTFASLLEKYDEGKSTSFLKEILDNGFFVTSDKEVHRLLSLVSSAIHDKSFFIDMEFKRQGYHIKNWKKRLILQRDMLIRELEESALELSKVILRSNIIIDSMPTRFGISSAQAKILLLLYKDPNLYFSMDYLIEYFSINFTPMQVKRAVMGLAKSSHLDLMKVEGKRSYTISGAGTKLISEFFKTIFDEKKI